MKHHWLLVVHLLAASVWVGGHLLLAIRYLPRALKQKDASVLKKFEESYESLGLPALLLLVVSGVAMAIDYGVTFSNVFRFENPVETVVSVKLILLFSTFMLAFHARLFIIPKLDSGKLLPMALHIVLITLIGVAMLVLGTFVRFGEL